LAGYVAVFAEVRNTVPSTRNMPPEQMKVRFMSSGISPARAISAPAKIIPQAEILIPFLDAFVLTGHPPLGDREIALV
jgi:hypothetical protein